MSIDLSDPEVQKEVRRTLRTLALSTQNDKTRNTLNQLLVELEYSDKVELVTKP